MLTAPSGEEVPTRSSRKPLAPLVVGAIGVVFGDIGTSPLYTLRECFSGAHGLPLTEGNVYGKHPPSRASVTYQRHMTGPNSTPTLAVPCRWIQNNPTRMRSVTESRTPAAPEP